MSHDPGPFESIESAHDFLGLFSGAVADAKQAVHASLQAESNANAPRRMDALRLALYNLEKLELHFNKSVRILNDLRSLRRLLFEERGAARAPATPEQPVLRQEIPATVAAGSSAQTVHSGAARKTAVAA
ncbi:MAG TPA: hypothetical protein VMS96_00610 [Terriglobales bacterium]|nr:hypothetical protein [Terriglobales bacterium]